MNITVEPTLITTAQEQMINAFNGADYEMLLTTMFRMEQQNAPDWNNSEFNIRQTDWKHDALSLLLELRRDVLVSILDNTFPQRALGDLRGELRDPATSNKSVDPLIYINYIADRDGRGIPTAEFPKFLATLEVAAGLPCADAALYELEQRAVRANMDHAYRQFHKFNNKRLPFFATILSKQANALQNSTRSYVAQQRIRYTEAVRQGVSHIAFHGEVGLSRNGNDRCKDHKKMYITLTPPLLAVLQIAARTMFPQKGFQLYQYVLFRVFKASQLKIGESVGSQVGASYITCGGINSAQAGVQGDADDLKTSQWDDICDNMIARGDVRHVEKNLEEYHAYLDRRIAEENRRIRNLEDERHEAAVSSELARLQARHEEVAQREEELVAGLREEIAVLRDLHAANDALGRFADSLEDL